MVGILAQEVSDLKNRRSDTSSTRSSAQSGTSTPRSQGMEPQVERMLSRLEEFEKAMQADRQSTTSPRSNRSLLEPTPVRSEVFQINTPTPSGSPPPSPEKTGSPLVASMQAEVGSGKGSDSPGSLKDWEKVQPLHLALRDPRQKLLEAMERVKEMPKNWELPANLKECVAQALLIQIFSRFGSMGDFAKHWIREHGVEKNHVANEMTMLAMVIDRQLISQPEFIASEGCEILCRRVLAIQRAFQECSSESDWRMPKGANAAKWKSKVRWDLASEIDWGKLSEEALSIPAVEAEIQERLQKKALFQKYLAKSQDSRSAEETG